MPGRGYWRLSRVSWIALGSLITGVSCASPSLDTPLTNTQVPTTTSAPQHEPAAPSATAPPSVAEQDILISQINAYGIGLIQPEAVSTENLRTVLRAANALGVTAARVLLDAERVDYSAQAAFGLLYGPTTIYIYPDKSSIDGVNVAINCGWEGRYAQACQLTSIFPEQLYPSTSWLILVAGRGVLEMDVSESSGLIAHELAHNLTWGNGHNPSNLGGFSFVRFVTDEFAIRYFDTFGVTAGIDAYRDEKARNAHPRWRAELTADAIASWAFDEIHGPYAESIANYVQQSMICDWLRKPDC